MRRLLICAALGVLGAVSARAESGNEYLNDCTRNVSYCYGYTLGVIEGFSDGSKRAWLRTPTPASGSPIQGQCIPDGITAGQARDIAVTYIKRHPERRQENAAELVMNAVMETWPCGHKESR